MDCQLISGDCRLQRVPFHKLERPYTKLNSSLISTTNYNDQMVQSGNTYYYVTTAVDSQGIESAYSNQAVATIQ